MLFACFLFCCSTVWWCVLSFCKDCIQHLRISFVLWSTMVSVSWPQKIGRGIQDSSGILLSSCHFPQLRSSRGGHVLQVFYFFQSLLPVAYQKLFLGKYSLLQAPGMTSCLHFLKCRHRPLPNLSFHPHPHHGNRFCDHVSSVLHLSNKPEELGFKAFLDALGCCSRSLPACVTPLI